MYRLDAEHPGQSHYHTSFCIKIYTIVKTTKSKQKYTKIIPNVYLTGYAVYTRPSCANTSKTRDHPW